MQPNSESLAFAQLRADFKARGWQQKASSHVLSELAVHVSICLAGQALYIFSTGWLLGLVGLLVSTYGTLGIATNAHTSSHGGTFERRWLNEWFSRLGFTFFAGMPSTAWRHSHLVVHHPAPNVMGVDDDADFAPFFASTDREVAASSGLWRQYLRFQWLFFPIICWVNVYLRHRSGWRFLIAQLRDPAKRKNEHWFDVAACALHYAVWIGVPALFMPLTHALAFYALRFAVLGYPLFIVLAPAHYPAEASALSKSDWSKDFVLLQTATTLNFRAGLIGGFVCSGLQYQIEHHLFPGYSHTFYKRMSPLVQEFCQRNGYPYRTIGWAEGVWKTLTIFYTPKIVQTDLQALRVAPVLFDEKSQGAVNVAGTSLTRPSVELSI